MNDTLEPQLRPGPPPPPSSSPGGADGPRPGRTVSAWLVVGLVLALITILQGAGQVIAVIGRESDTVEQTVDARPELVVRLGSGDVTVTAAGTGAQAGTGTIAVRAHRSWALNEPELEWTTTADRVELRVRCGFVLVGWCSANLELTVPADTRLDVDTNSGEVIATGLRADVKLSTDSGRVSARDVSGSADLSTDSGDVQVTGARGDLLLQTDSGSIDVFDSGVGTLEADTDSGSISLDLVTDPQRVVAKTDSGRVEIQLPDTPGVAYLLDLSTGSGSTDGAVRTDPASTRTITAKSDSGNVIVRYR